MNIVESLYLRFKKYLVRVNWLAPLITRITIGCVFIEAGWGKIPNLPKVIDFFQSLGIPAAQFQAPLVAGTELIGGILILIGMLSRIISFPLMIIMIVAIFTAKQDEISTLTDIFGFSEYLYIVLLMWLSVAGAGPMSVDAVYAKIRGIDKKPV